MDGQVAAGRLEPQPHQPAAGLDQRRLATSAARSTIAPGRRRERVAGEVAEALAAVERGEEVHADAGPQHVHRRAVGAVELE